MRDYSLRTSDFAYTISAVEKSPLCVSSPFLATKKSYTKNNFLVSLKGRGDVLPSDGHRPTYYYGFKYECNHLPFNIWREFTYACTSPAGLVVPTRRVGEGVAPQSLSRMTRGFHFRNLGNGIYKLEPKLHQGIRAQARNAVLKELSRSDLNLGQFLAEINSSSQLILSRALSIVQLLNALRKGKLSDAAGAITSGTVGIKPGGGRSSLGGFTVYRRKKPSSNSGKTAADLYLEGQFGWAPLINDLVSIANGALARLTQKSGFPVKTVTRTRTEVLDQASVNGNETISGSVLYGHKCSVTYTVADSQLAGLNALGLVNPFALGFEVLPLSFVLNWFISVGDYLSGLSAGIGLEYLHGYETRWAQSDIKVVDVFLQVNWNLPEGSPPTSLSNGFGFIRTPSPGFPTPAIWVRLSLDSNKLSTLLALAAQRS